MPDRRVVAPPAVPSRAEAVPIVLLYVVCLAGRYSIGHVSLLGLGDVRVLGCGLLATVAFFWRVARHSGGYTHRWPRSAAWVLALFGLLAVAAFWAPPSARVGDKLGDLAALGVLIVVAVVVTGAEPERCARILLWLAGSTGLVYAAAAFAEGAGRQGRYTAFGGGPNVFARVVCMAILAAGVLALVRRQKWPLLAVPPLGVAAVLSGSRGGLLALGVALLVFYGLFARRLRPSAVLASAGLAIAAAALTGWLAAGQAELLAAHRYSFGDLQNTDFSYRLPLLSDAWRVFSAHPWTGGGMDAFYAGYGQYIGLGYVHNFPAAVACETGVLGAAVVVGTALRWFADGRPWRELAPERLGCVVLAAYISSESLFSGDYYDTRWMWVFALVAVNRTSTTKATAWVPASDCPPARRPRSSSRDSYSVAS
jgi:O-antigen ligase